MPPLIFTHYGNPKYLYYTLTYAKRTNPKRRLILIGDENNKNLALNCGWEWFNVDSFKSPLINEFNNVFKVISGSEHGDFKNGRLWVHYVFYRWFAIYELVKKENIAQFWHFDSDTLIIESLSHYDELFNYHDGMMQCNKSCLNGFVNSNIIIDYLKSIISQFKNKDLLLYYEEEFKKNKTFAFTEMRAFVNFRNTSDLDFISGFDIYESEVFDDCLLQGHGFNTITMLDKRKMKDIEFSGHHAYFFKKDTTIKAITLNLSWLHDDYYPLFIKLLEKNKTIRLSNYNLPILFKTKLNIYKLSLVMYLFFVKKMPILRSIKNKIFR